MLPQLHCGNFMAREFIGQMKTKFIFIVNSFSWILLPAWTHLPSLLIPAKSIVRSPFPLSRDNLLHHSIPLLWITNAVQRPHTVSYMVPFVHQNNPQRQPPHSLSCFTAMVTLLTPWEFVTNYHSMDHYTLDSACSSLSIKFKLIIISIVSLSPTAFHYPLHWDNTITAPATSSNVQWFDDHLHLFLTPKLDAPSVISIVHLRQQLVDNRKPQEPWVISNVPCSLLPVTTYLGDCAYLPQPCVKSNINIQTSDFILKPIDI